MNFQNDRYTLRLATATDNEGIREVFENSTFKGGISVQYLRNPKPYESFLADGDSTKIMIMVDNLTKKTIGVGGVVLRHEYVNGKSESCAYLTGLKLLPDYQRKFPFLTKAYALMHEEVSSCRYFYTTILDDNLPAISMLEKKRKYMPEYRYLGHYTTYCFNGARKMVELEKNNTEGFDKLMETHFSKINFTPVNYDCAGFGDKNFYCLKENGEIIACCFVGNQQKHKQYKMDSYGGIYKIVSKFPTKLFGYPEFPKSDSIINHGVISYLYVKDCDKKLCKAFLRSVAAAEDFSLLIWGGFENNPLCVAFETMKTVRYGSRLYSVLWNGEQEISGLIGVEAALL